MGVTLWEKKEAGNCLAVNIKLQFLEMFGIRAVIGT